MPLINLGGQYVNTDHIVRIVPNKPEKPYYTISFADKSCMYVYSDTDPVAYNAVKAWLSTVPTIGV